MRYAQSTQRSIAPYPVRMDDDGLCHLDNEAILDNLLAS